MSKYFDPMFGSQPHKEFREYRSDIVLDGSVRYEANHICFLPIVNRYYRASRIDLEEWFASLGFLPDRNVPLLEETLASVRSKPRLLPTALRGSCKTRSIR